jgi:hypothetical protein
MEGFDEYYTKEVLHMPELSSKTTPSVTPTKRTPKK